MEFKENVIYVTPDGVAVSKETFSKIKKGIIGLWESLKKIIQNLASNLTLMFKETFKAIEIEEAKNKFIMKRALGVPRNIVKRSQVMNRKPRFIHARSQL